MSEHLCKLEDEENLKKRKRKRYAWNTVNREYLRCVKIGYYHIKTKKVSCVPKRLKTKTLKSQLFH